MNPKVLLFLLFPLTSALKLNSVCLSPITKPKVLGIYTCDCVIENSSDWGEQVLIVNCAELELRSLDYPAATLPENTAVLDLSYNALDRVPPIDTEHLRFLDLSTNDIDVLRDYDFVKLKGLVQLNLARNRIARLSEHSLFGLRGVLEVDFSNNNISKLMPKVFEPMTNVKRLILSGNQPLGALLSHVLEVERSNLTSINVGRGAGLRVLKVAMNNLTDLDELPFALETLDISANPFERIFPGLLSNLQYLKTLLVQDMPNLTTVEAESFSTLRQLTYVSFQGSTQLSHFNSEAFGNPDETELSLETLNLEGTSIHTFNESMVRVARGLKSFNLEGVPLECDCNVAWIKQLPYETNAICTEPSSLRGVLVSGVPERNLVCRLFPKWVYTTFNSILILLVLVGCSALVWFVFMKLRRKTTSGHSKVGSTSPYAPVTTVSS